jgi:hypothetical protein
MMLRGLPNYNSGLTFRANLFAAGFAGVILVFACAYLVVLFQLSSYQANSEALFQYRETVLQLRDTFQRVGVEAPESVRDTAARRAWVESWLEKLEVAQRALPNEESLQRLERDSGVELERVMHSLVQSYGVAEMNAVRTEIDVVCDQSRALLLGQQDNVASFLARARWFGFAIATAVLITLVIAARRWTRREIAAPLTAICNELERTSKETAHSGTQLDVSANRVLAASTIQAEAIQETVAAMNEITAMVAQTTNRAGSSATEARAVLEKTRAGKAVVSEMNEAMQSLSQANEKLERISKIFKQISHKTTVINEIAFKTKMLSINAAVEAARAGQHGRGFSVVASEVGNLSKLSAEAANAVRALLASSQQEVSDIIETTSAQVRAGSRVTTAVDQAFSEIAKAIQQVAEQAVAISQAANEQELGVKQTASGIEQIHSKMLETRSVAESTRAELRVVNEQSSRLVAISAELRHVLHGATSLPSHSQVERHVTLTGNNDGYSSAGNLEDAEAAALVRRLGEAAREGRGQAANPANDNTSRGRANG